MTIEEKAQAYDKAINIFKETYHNFNDDTKIIVNKAFPELIESENERISNFIIECLIELRKANPNTDFNAECSDAIYWLEKQKKTNNE